MKWVTALFVAGMATGARADHHSLQFDDCGEGSIARTHAAYLVEPWEENTLYLSKHNLRFVVLGTGEPTPRAYYLMLLGNPPQHPGEIGPRLCRIVTIEGSTGFSSIEMSASSTEETLRRGRDYLTFTVPVEITSKAGTTRRQALSVGYLHENGNASAELLDY